MNRLNAILIAFAVLLFTTCSQPQPKQNNIIPVSILPIKYLVANIVGDDFIINVLVPPGSSPETYEPTPLQMKSIYESKMIFTIGLIDFERQLIDKLEHQTQHRTDVTELYHGINLMQGHCGHLHSHEEVEHGVDPHIWTSPVELRVMAKNIFTKIDELYPDSVKYRDNYAALDQCLDSLDKCIAHMLSASNTKQFIIYHPALTYYARRYGIEQIPLEHEGKEPSVRQLHDFAVKAKDNNIKYIYYQKQFSKSVVETIAADLGATVVEIDPLREDIVDNLLYITSLISR